MWRPTEEGIVVLDLLSGIGTAMAAVVRAGVNLKRWYALEKDAAEVEAAKCLRTAMVKECKRTVPTRQADGIPQDTRYASEVVDLIVAG